MTIQSRRLAAFWSAVAASSPFTGAGFAAPFVSMWLYANAPDYMRDTHGSRDGGPLGFVWAFTTLVFVLVCGCMAMFAYGFAYDASLS